MQPFIDALTALFQLVAAHKRGVIITVALIILYWVFNAAVSAMAPPDDPKSRYAYWYRMLNRLAGNFDKVAKVLHVPGADQP